MEWEPKLTIKDRLIILIAPAMSDSFKNVMKKIHKQEIAEYEKDGKVWYN